MNTRKQKLTAWLIASALTGALSGCNAMNSQTDSTPTVKQDFNGTVIMLSDDGIFVNGETATDDSNADVTISNDIIYYEEGHDDSYGEGSEAEAHSADEALKHTVVKINKAGNYLLSGTLSAGQILIDLGEEASEDPQAVVNLTLDNVNLTSSVSSAIVVLNAYECSADSMDNPSKDVDTSNAGFNLILADHSVNVIHGSHVAKIYKEGTTKKKYKFDGAIESKVSMNINGGEVGNGQLTLNADNEGIESCMHLTINGGILTIHSADDALNANEDGVSVITINGGTILCDAGNGVEGDGIDSNGWIVINGGTTISSANPNSMDSGVDSDLGIYINGGTLLATGNMVDEISSESSQQFMVMNFSEKQNEQDIIVLRNAEEQAITAFFAVNDYTALIYSSDLLVAGEYSLAKASAVTGELNGSIYTSIKETQDLIPLEYSSTGRGMGRGMKPEVFEGMPKDDGRFDKPDMQERPERFEKGEKPEHTPDFEEQTTNDERLTTIVLDGNPMFLYSISAQ